jgi:hypothetical protein
MSKDYDIYRKKGKVKYSFNKDEEKEKEKENPNTTKIGLTIAILAGMGLVYGFGFFFQFSSFLLDTDAYEIETNLEYKVQDGDMLIWKVKYYKNITQVEGHTLYDKTYYDVYNFSFSQNGSYGNPAIMIFDYARNVTNNPDLIPSNINDDINYKVINNNEMFINRELINVIKPFYIFPNDINETILFDNNFSRVVHDFRPLKANFDNLQFNHIDRFDNYRFNLTLTPILSYWEDFNSSDIIITSGELKGERFRINCNPYESNLTISVDVDYDKPLEDVLDTDTFSIVEAEEITNIYDLLSNIEEFRNISLNNITFITDDNNCFKWEAEFRGVNDDIFAFNTTFYASVNQTVMANMNKTSHLFDNITIQRSAFVEVNDTQTIIIDFETFNITLAYQSGFYIEDPIPEEPEEPEEPQNPIRNLYYSLLYIGTSVGGTFSITYVWNFADINKD